MWINKELSEKHKLSPDIINKLSNWKKINPEATINFWYDGKMTPLWAQIDINAKLKDIRNLRFSEYNEDILGETIPVYFRADLLRSVCTYEYLRDTHDDYFVYSDIDVKPMSKSLLFDDETIKELDRSGIVLAKSDETMFENSFFIVANNNNTLKAIKIFLIDLNVLRCRNALHDNFSNGTFKNYRYNNKLSLLSESVFCSYIPMLKYISTLNNYGKILICGYKNKTDDIPYNFETHGFNYLYTDILTDNLGRNLIYLGESYLNYTKKIDAPPVKGYYEYVTPIAVPWYIKIFQSIFPYKLW